MRLNKRVLILISILLCMFSEAAEKLDLEKAYQESKATAKHLNPNLQELSQGRGKIGELQDVLNTQGQAHHKTTTLDNLPILGATEKENDTENATCTKSQCNVASVMSTNATQKREAKLEEYGFTKDVEQFTKDDKGYIDKVRQNARKFENIHDAISGSYKDCKLNDQSYSYSESKQCDEYYDVKYSNCPVIQKVEIDSHYTYMCNSMREEKEKKCEEELTLKCIKAQKEIKRVNPVDYYEEVQNVRNYDYGVDGVNQLQRKVKEKARFLSQKGVCYEDIENYLGELLCGGNCANVNHLIGQSGIPRTACLIPQEKKCLEWKEEWNKKCEYVN